jgi:hypothetical protein
MQLGQKNPTTTSFFSDYLATCFNCQNKFWTVVKTAKINEKRIRFCAECKAGK